MSTPCGFGKNYFTLSAIVAYSCAPLLQAQTSRMAPLLHVNKITHTQDDFDESPPDEELLSTPVVPPKKPCHCNHFFKIRIRLILLLNHFIPRCPFYTTYFAFRRTGVHPPS